MPAAERVIEVGVGPKAFYELITDFESYPEFLTGIQRAVILERGKSGKKDVFRVRNEMNLVKKFSFVLSLTGVPGKSLEWTLEESDLLKKNEGAWVLEAKGKNATIATYRAELEIRGFLPKTIVNTMVEADMPRMLDSFKVRAEGGELEVPAEGYA